MPDVKKVIKGLECCIKHDPDDKMRCGECPYEGACLNRLKVDALALLKAQEPRLVEPNDFENADDFNWLPAWCEERTGAGYWEMILPDALDEKDVRYWTGRLTDEQREAVKWE